MYALVQALGPAAVLEVATRFGVGVGSPTVRNLALGGLEGSLWQITALYAAFAGGGMFHEPHVIVETATPAGDTVYRRAGVAPRRIAAQAHVRVINRVLRKVVTDARGTGRTAYVPTVRVAGKTGTSQWGRDGWFIGFSAHLTTGVWVAGADPAHAVSGGGAPARTFADFNRNVHPALRLDGSRRLAGNVE